MTENLPAPNQEGPLPPQFIGLNPKPPLMTKER